MRTHRWYAHPRQTAVVFCLPPQTRNSLAAALRAELLTASYEALAAGMNPRLLAAELQSRAAALRAGAAMPGPGVAARPNAAVRHASTLRRRGTPGQRL